MILQEKCAGGGSTIYGSAVQHAINKWNAMGIVTIKKDDITSIEDLTIRDVNNGRLNYAARTYTTVLNTGYMEFNTAKMQNYTGNEIIKTALHEFGHALGISEINGYSNQVMEQGQIELTELGYMDKAAYNCIW